MTPAAHDLLRELRGGEGARGHWAERMRRGRP
jgi:hypothetical protein